MIADSGKEYGYFLWMIFQIYRSMVHETSFFLYMIYPVSSTKGMHKASYILLTSQGCNRVTLSCFFRRNQSTQQCQEDAEQN